MLDDTLVFYIIDDNGASAEGTINGTLQRDVELNGLPADIETPRFMTDRLKFGGPESHNHYSVGSRMRWIPLSVDQQVASHCVRTRNGTIVHWLNVTPRGDALRHHVIDVAPTILEAAGVATELVIRQRRQQHHRRSAWPTCSTTRRRRPASRRSIRDVRKPGHLPQGLDRGDQAQDAVDFAKSRPSRSTTTWSSTTPPRSWFSGQRRPREMLEAKPYELQRLWLIEATRYNVLWLTTTSLCH